MENIRKAIERAKARSGGSVGTRQPPPRIDPRHTPEFIPTTAPYISEVELDRAHLVANRIIAHGQPTRLSRPFDMLRTQVLQAMDAKNYRVVGITSPTPSCGKTVTAINLALNIARQLERSVTLVDLDLQKPRVASTLGVGDCASVSDVLLGRATLSEGTLYGCIDSQRLALLPAKETFGSSELLASSATAAFFQDLRHAFPSSTIIIDLPPILSTDEVISVLPHLDCAILVAAVGQTKLSEIEDCTHHLKGTDVLRVVVNKTTDPQSSYYYY